MAKIKKLVAKNGATNICRGPELARTDKRSNIFVRMDTKTWFPLVN